MKKAGAIYNIRSFGALFNDDVVVIKRSFDDGQVLV